MSDHESKHTAAQLDHRAEQRAGLGGASAALRIIVRALRGDEAGLNDGSFSSCTTSRSASCGRRDAQARAVGEQGNLDARRAAEYLAATGAIYYGESR